MPDSSNFLYPTLEAAPRTREDDINGLLELSKAIDRGKEKLEKFERIKSLPYLSPERLFYSSQEIHDEIEIAHTIIRNMTKCYNSHLEQMKIK